MSAIQKVSYSHEAMAEVIIGSQGRVSQRELAAHFGYTEGWISQILASDSFQAFLSKKKVELVDPLLRGAVEEGFKGLVLQSTVILRQKLESNPSDDLVLEVFKAGAKAMGYGARPTIAVTNQTNIQNNSLVAVLRDLQPPSRQAPPPKPPIIATEVKRINEADDALALLECPLPA